MQFLIGTLLILSLSLGSCAPPQKPAAEEVHQALVLRFENVESASKEARDIRDRLSRSQSFNTVAWRGDELFCFLTSKGQVVDEGVVDHWLEGQWSPTDSEYRRSVPLFGTASGTKSAP